MGRIKKMVYKGTNNPFLIDGKEYTYSEYAKAANVSYRCMMSRIGGKHMVTDNDLKPLDTSKIPKSWRNDTNYQISRFEHPSEKLMDQWLRKAL